MSSINHFILLTTLLIAQAASQSPQEVRCRYEFYNGDYSCFLTIVNITTASVPLSFPGFHWGGMTRLNVSVIRTPSTSPNPIVISVIHPQLFEEFPNLRKLLLPYAVMRNLTLEHCGMIDEIDLYGNLLTSLPSRVFANCTSLKRLSLVYNNIQETFEDSFSGLISLEYLNVRQNIRVNIFNNSLDDSTSLREFRFAGNGNIALGALSKLISLEVVDISHYLPFFDNVKVLLDGLNNLKSIDLTGNGFMEVDLRFFAQFSNLERLILANNGLSDIPNGAFDGFSQLKHLSLADNFITALNPETFASLNSLEYLSLADNFIADLNSLPFADLRQLTTLDISDNLLLTLPDSVFESNVNLENLMVGKNALSEVNSTLFGPLVNLTQLRLNGNRFKSLPEGNFVALPKLQLIDLSDNEIVRLNRNSFGLLSSLKSFTINYSYLDEIEPSFFENFPNLTYFNGYGNDCISGTVDDMSLIDFSVENVFSECFYNWQYGRTTTTSTEGSTDGGFESTTPGGVGKLGIEFGLLGLMLVGYFLTGF